MYEHDLLIIGAGLAGLRAAVEGVRGGADVAVVTKVHPVRSHSNAAQGGINAPLTDRGDDWEGHALDTIKGSDYLADQDAVELMSREAGRAVIELEHMGVIFSRDEEGRLGTRRFGGQKVARTFFVGAITGSALLHVLYEQALKYGLRVYEEWFVTSLVKEDGQVRGAVVLDIKTGDLHTIRAQGGDHRRRGRGTSVRALHQRNHMHRGRNGVGMARRGAHDGHGDDPVPPHNAGEDRHPDVGGGPRRGRIPVEQGRRPVHEDLRAGLLGTGLKGRGFALRADRNK